MDRPTDFSISLASNNGSLPPPHRRSSRITIGARGQGVVKSKKGYKSGSATSRTFALDGEAMDSLYADLVAFGLFRTVWTEAERHSIGGGIVRVSATVSGESVAIPAFVVEEQREAKAEIAARVREAVPEG